MAGALIAAAILLVSRSASLARTTSASLPSSDESPLERALRLYPPTQTNAAALDIEDLAKPLGIDLMSGVRRGRHPLTTRQAAGFEKIQEAMLSWLDAELRRVSIQISAPPADVAAYLTSRTGNLAALRRGLLRGEPPVWQDHVGSDAWWPTTNLVSIILLHRVLAADALEAERSGRRAVALEDLEASWRLNEKLWTAPFRASRRMAVAATRWQVGILRRMDSVPRVWRERLARLRPVEAIYEALRLETSLWPIINAGSCSERSSSITDLVSERVCSLIAQPYVRFGMEDASGRYLAQLDRFDPSRAFCDAKIPDVSIEVLKAHMPIWNRTGGMISESGEYSLRSAERLALDTEMTLKILDLKQARDEDQGRWPESVAGLERSRVCPQDHWMYERAKDGTVSLTLSRKLDWGASLGVVLPTRYEERPSREKIPARVPPK